MSSIVFRKLHPDAVIPEYKTHEAAGFDLHSVERVELTPGQISLVDLGLSCEMRSSQSDHPVHTLMELQIRSRSGLAIKQGVIVLNSPGTVDQDYRGPLKVILANFGSQPYTIEKGERIAQGVVNRIERVRIQETTAEHDQTERGAGGFGSTGRF